MHRFSFLLSALSSVGRVISRFLSAFDGVPAAETYSIGSRWSPADRSFIVPLFAACSGKSARYFLGFQAHIRVMDITRVELRNAVGLAGVRPGVLG